jgi:hypothetical protein
VRAPTPAPPHPVQVRLMAQEHLGRYANSWDCLRKVVASEGLAALATGAPASLPAWPSTCVTPLGAACRAWWAARGARGHGVRCLPLMA